MSNIDGVSIDFELGCTVAVVLEIGVKVTFDARSRVVVKASDSFR